MECPNPHCDGKLIITRVVSSLLGMDGEVPTATLDDCEDYIVCTECGESPSYTWEVDEMSETKTEGRIVLMEKDVL